MKRVFFLITVLIGGITWAQIPVTDVAANGNLAAINTQLSTISAMMGKQMAVGMENKYENYAQKILGQKNLDFIKQVEDYMWKADEYLKKGREIQMIYNKEEDILKKLKELRRNAANYGNLDGNTNLINSLNKNISVTLNNVGTLVDGAQTILGDNNTRMSTAERREFLKETIGRLMIIENVLDELNSSSKRSSFLTDRYYQRLERQRRQDEQMREFLRKK